MSRKREATSTSLAAAMRAYVGRLDTEGKLGQAAIIDAWPSITGEKIAGHTRVEGLREGELLVSVDSAVWANELSLMGEKLRSRLNRNVGQELVRSIRFTVSQSVEEERDERGIEAEADRRYGGAKVEPIALTDEEMLIVERSIEGIADEELRSAAQKATIRDLEWKKGLEALNAAEGEAGGLSGAKTGRKP